MHRMTALGLDERLERVFAYLFLWVSGLILFFFETRPTESSRNVRWNAVQSMVTFGTLSLLMLGVSVLRSMLGWLPILGLVADFGLGLLANILWWTTLILWIWLMIMAWVQPRYHLPYISNWVRYIVY